jgi:hypothetical protein
MKKNSIEALASKPPPAGGTAVKAIKKKVETYY